MLCWGLFGLVVYLYVREKKQRLGSECLASQEVHATAKEKLANFIKKKGERSKQSVGSKRDAGYAYHGVQKESSKEYGYCRPKKWHCANIKKI
jgi:hypothetical protein